MISQLSPNNQWQCDSSASSWVVFPGCRLALLMRTSLCCNLLNLDRDKHDGGLSDCSPKHYLASLTFHVETNRWSAIWALIEFTRYVQNKLAHNVYNTFLFLNTLDVKLWLEASLFLSWQAEESKFAVVYSRSIFTILCWLRLGYQCEYLAMFTRWGLASTQMFLLSSLFNGVRNSATMLIPSEI